MSDWSNADDDLEIVQDLGTDLTEEIPDLGADLVSEGDSSISNIQPLNDVAPVVTDDTPYANSSDDLVITASGNAPPTDVSKPPSAPPPPGDPPQTPSRLKRLDGNDPEANFWNTEYDLIKDHAADVKAGRAQSGEQIAREMYDLNQEDKPT